VRKFRPRVTSAITAATLAALTCVGGAGLTTPAEAASSGAVIANHFDSKLGDQSADGRFQFPAQSSAVQRAGQALVEHNFINQILAIDKKADVVLVGDLNDYQFSPALSVLKTGTSDGSGKPTLTDLITTLPASQQYTYDFEGVSEVLDHILLSKGIKDFTYQPVHVNSEFANQTSDHDPQVVEFKP
jgi:hypothetical protein